MRKILDLPFTNVFLFSLFWALQLFFSKLAFQAGAHPVTFFLQSQLINWFILAIIVLPQKWKEIKNLNQIILKQIIIASTIHLGLGAVLANIGVAFTTAINAGFLVKFTLVTTLLIAWIILREKMTLPKISAAILMFIGVFLLSTKAQLIIPNFGDLLILAACFAWSTGNVLVRKILKNHAVSGEAITFLRPIFGSPLVILFVVLAPFYPEKLKNVFQVNLLSLDYFVYVFIVGVFTALLMLFLHRTLKIASASYMSMMSMMTPVFTTLLAFIFLHERMITIQVFGAALIIGSSVVTHLMKVEKS